MSYQRWISGVAAAIVVGCGGHATPATTTPAPTPAAPSPVTTTRPPASGATSGGAATSADGMRSTLAAVYTDAQAAAGKDVYAGRCQSCHTGEHASSAFRRKWGGRPLQDLSRLIRETMPDDSPGGLSVEEYTNVIAYILKLNGLPAGATPLPGDTLALKKIRLDTLSTKQ